MLTAGQATVIGCGMASAFGTHAASECAAAWAGIRRARALPELVLADADGDDLLPTGHAADLLTRGFEGFGRHLRLFSAALADLARSCWAQIGAPPPSAHVYLALPDPQREYSELEHITNPKAQERRRTAASEREPQSSEETAVMLLRRSAQILGWSSPPRLAGVFTGGRTCFTEALGAALRDLSSGSEMDVAIVGAVDSLLDLETLLWLHELGLLKHAENPVGVEPGEAAGLLALGRPNRGPSTPLARVVAGSISQISPENPPGTALADVVVDLQTRLDAANAPAWILVDHDGTVRSAADIGSAVARIGARWPGRAPELTYPLASFGDVGAATGVVASCLALAAIDRRWIPHRAALVVTSAGPQRIAHAIIAD